MTPPKTLDHPSFGECELIPTIVAIRWKRPTPQETVKSNLSGQALTIATETTPKPKEKAAGPGRDPRLGEINNSELLTFVSAKTPLTDNALTKLSGNENVEWVAPVYRSIKADPGPVSYFAINPTVLLVAPDVLAALGDLKSVEESASINEQRSRLLKGFVVLNIPNANAIELAQRIKDKAGAAAAKGIKFENIPYISPTATCSSCAGTSSRHAPDRRGRCSPALTDLI
ncbi:MAG TPA: hypothetical protein VK274_09245, partial [Pyrinomonadaceae bacterium]|nr:hypothetical protein [Pyrinomonadaceae bacterium]